jgi:hypothetical protein
MNMVAGKLTTCKAMFVILLFSMATDISAQNSRAATAASYIQRGRTWMESGDTK